MKLKKKINYNIKSTRERKLWKKEVQERHQIKMKKEDMEKKKLKEKLRKKRHERKYRFEDVKKRREDRH